MEKKKNVSKAAAALDNALGIATEDIIEASIIEDVPASIPESNFEIIPAGGDKVLTQRDKDVEDDYDLARATMKGLLGKANTAIDRILELAKDSDHPRVIEVASGLIKTTADVATDLMKVHKVKNDLEHPGQKTAPDGGGETVNTTTVYIGSTADLKKQIDKSEDSNK